ncbi:MAG: hypothetical protein AAF438_17335, partial [Pseudomonadota bacterium]
MMRRFPILSTAQTRPFSNAVCTSRHRSSIVPFGRRIPAFSVRPCLYRVLPTEALFAVRVDTKALDSLLIRGGATRQFSTARQHVDVSSDDSLHRAYIAVGSNLGDRYANIQSALELLCDFSWQNNDKSEN